MGKLVSCPLNEYAKVVWYRVDRSGKGLQAQVTLPSAKHFNGSGDFINFYLGFGGWEVGVSTRPSKPVGDTNPNPDSKWHWFVNSSSSIGEYDFSQPWIYPDGSLVRLKAFFNSVGQMEFHVNGVRVFQSMHKTTTAQNNVRFVVASAQQSTSSDHPWEITHNQVTIGDLMYRDANDNWLRVTSDNGRVEYANCPDSANDISYRYTELTYNGSRVYASLKK